MGCGMDSRVSTGASGHAREEPGNPRECGEPRGSHAQLDSRLPPCARGRAREERVRAEGPVARAVLDRMRDLRYNEAATENVQRFPSVLGGDACNALQRLQGANGGTEVFESDLCNGFLLGFLTASVVGLVGQRLLLLSKKAGAADKKVAVVETKQSPRQVYRSSMRAQMEMAIWFIVLIVVVVAVVWAYLS
jgi:hypothetical protein